MRVIHIIGSARIGGIEKLVLDLLTVQKTNPAISVGILIGKKEGELLHKFRNVGIPYSFAKISSGYDLNIKKYYKVYKLFKQYDIIHFHSFNLFFSLSAIFSRKKIVYTEHGNFGFGRNRKKSDVLKQFLLRIFLNKFVSFVSFNSEFTRFVAEKRYKLKKVNKGVVYNGILLKNENENIKIDIEPELRKKTENKFVVGTSSRFAGFKRIDRLIKGFADFQEGKDALLLLVGDGILRKNLEELVKQYGIVKETFFTGYKQNASVYQSLMDVCVFPSQNEPFGLVAIETLALGKPTLVFEDGGGITEIINSISQNDIVKDIKDLSDRLSYYYFNRPKVTENKYRRINYAKKFDIAKMEKKFFQIYNEVL